MVLFSMVTELYGKRIDLQTKKYGKMINENGSIPLDFAINL